MGVLDGHCVSTPKKISWADWSKQFSPSVIQENKNEVKPSDELDIIAQTAGQTDPAIDQFAAQAGGQWWTPSPGMTWNQPLTVTASGGTWPTWTATDNWEERLKPKNTNWIDLGGRKANYAGHDTLLDPSEIAAIMDIVAKAIERDLLKEAERVTASVREASRTGDEVVLAPSGDVAPKHAALAPPLPSESSDSAEDLS